MPGPMPSAVFCALAEDHRSYMDRFAGLIDLADRDAAERFAADEPYARAGLYVRITVDPVRSCSAGARLRPWRPERGRRCSGALT